MGIFNKKQPLNDNGQRDTVVGNMQENLSRTHYLKEMLKGLVTTKKIRFPKDLGQEHPFDYNEMTSIAKKVGVVSAIVDKHVDFMMSGGINIRSEDKRSEEIINTFMMENDFDSMMRSWLRQAFLKGFSPLELGSGDNGGIEGLRLLQSDNIYVSRSETGVIEGFNQYTKPYTEFGKQKAEEDVIEFEPEEIADLNINIYGDDYYGYGLVYTLLGNINYLVGSRKEMHTLMRRKANSPLIMTGGDKTANGGKGEFPSETELTGMGSKLQVLTNKHEWTITDFWKASTIDFGNIGEKFNFIVENDIDMLYSAAQVPSVLMGRGSIPEGLAKVQMRAFELRIQSLREDTEKVIESKIFKRVLRANGLNTHVEVIWGIPSQEEKLDRARAITEVLKIPFLSSNLIFKLEEELALSFGIPAEEVEDSSEERDREEEEELTPKVPGSNRKEPTSTPRDSKEREHFIGEKYSVEELEELDNMTVSEFVNFNYKKYEDGVIGVTERDVFELLKANTRVELEAGMLSTKDVDKLRTTMIEGFKDNKTIKEIATDLERRIDFSDRYRMKDGKLTLNKDGEKILSLRKEYRPISIARTETVRLSNLGAVENYKKSGVKNVSWVSSMSIRTCEQCASLNGMVFPIDSNVRPPLHSLCRCTVIPVVE